jgi:hypothetical protein
MNAVAESLILTRDKRAFVSSSRRPNLAESALTAPRYAVYSKRQFFWGLSSFPARKGQGNERGQDHFRTPVNP